MTLPFEQDNTKYGLSDFFHLCYLVVGKTRGGRTTYQINHKQKLSYTCLLLYLVGKKATCEFNTDEYDFLGDW